MTKHSRTKKRSQKGGFFGLFSGGDEQNINSAASPSSSSWFNLGSLWENTKNKTSGLLEGANNLVGQTANTISSSISDSVSSASNLLNQDVPLSNTNSSVSSVPDSASVAAAPEMVASYPSQASISTGGKRRSKSRSNKRSKSMKGGKNGLGLTYYASPVSGLAVAKPTYWMNANGDCKLTKGGSRKRRVKKTRKNHRHKKH